MRKVLDAAALEASLLRGNDSEVIEFNDELSEQEAFNDEAVIIPGRKSRPMPVSGKMSYVDTCAVSSSPRSRPSMTLEELEAQLASGMSVSPHSPASQLVSAGPPPGLVTSPKSNTIATTTTSTAILPSGPSQPYLATSSTAPLSRDDPNRGFMNRFERDLIQRIHTHQLTTDNPHMDDFYYQSLTKKRAASAANVTAAPLLYFPLPSVADREREFQRRQQRRARREREQAAKEGREPETVPVKSSKESSGEALELVLGKVTHSSSRKPRQQLQIPSTFAEGGAVKQDILVSLHERVLKSIEAVYVAVLSVEDCYLRAEGVAVERGEDSVPSEEVEKKPEFTNLLQSAQLQVSQELGLLTESGEEADHEFIHFLTIPKGKGILPRALKILPAEQRERFLFKLVQFFDFLDVVRPETPVAVVDAFISSVLSPLVAFVGEAEWETVLKALKDIFAKRSFVWIALTKAGIVLLCILLSRVEILKATAPGEEGSGEVEEAAKLTERVFDALEGHLGELFTVRVADNREFYAWQFLALLAMNVDSERKRNMIMELRDKILMIVESGDESSINNLNVFLNALGLDASQLS